MFDNLIGLIRNILMVNILKNYFKNTNKTVLLFFILTLFLSLNIHFQTIFAFGETEENQMIQKIWALEEAYVTYFRDAAHDKVIPLWHERFLGWPNSESRPTDKNGVVRYLKRNSQNPGAWSFKIEKTGIRITGKIAITHYNLIIGGAKTRVTHTWIHENSGWKVLGGMSARR